MDSLKLKNQMCFPLYAASRLVIQAYNPMLKQMGITYSQYLVLLALWENDSQSVTELGEKLFLDSGTLTPVLKNLAKSQLIIRRRNPKDDRTVINSLTASGKELEVAAARLLDQTLCASGLSVSEIDKFRKQTRALLSRLLEIREPTLS